MANIICKITIDANGNATVTHQVNAATGGDTLTFTSNRDDTVIRFPTASPFLANGGPKIGQNFLVGKKQGPFTIEKFPAAGKSFHFECGKKVGSKFVPWGGGGGDAPGPKDG